MPHFELPSPGKQVYIAAFLANVRGVGLHEAVQHAARLVDASTLRDDLSRVAPPRGLALVQGTGVRDEEVFATPSLLRAAPGTLAYYRLLLGISQKAFYTGKSGLTPFKSMEGRQVVSSAADPMLDDLCVLLNEAMSDLLHALPIESLRRDVDQLPIMALGAQADGSWRTQIGSKATQQIFEAMKQIVRSQNHLFTETDVSITVVNNSQREVTLALAPDPDVVIRESFGTSSEYKAAIEIKGGTDYSNVHNRAGEAEKSHAKAIASGAGACWTIIDLRGVDMARLRSESTSTREWIDLTEVLKQNGPSWDRLGQITRSAMGI